MRSPLLFLGLGLVVPVLVGACGGGESGSPPVKYAPRNEGCDVKISTQAPGVMSDNIGPVTATCAPDVSDADCLRTLEDQVCKLGGDLVWGVSPTPENVNGKKRFAGRAAHTQVGSAK